MAKVKRTFNYPFSRLKNHLVELQRWWPAFVKGDGTGGITVDPVLYRTNFGPRTDADEGLYNDESNTPGVRVEAINDDGTEPSLNISFTNSLQVTSTATSIVISNADRVGASGTGTIGGDTFTWTGKTSSTLSGVSISSTGQTYAQGTTMTQTAGVDPDGNTLNPVTITISGSGTYSPLCKIRYLDGRSYSFYLIAPTGEQTNGTAVQDAYEMGGVTVGGRSNPGAVGLDSGNIEGTLRWSGPYPVFMTIQEFAEMLDTYRHIGNLDTQKPAWLPHGMIGDDFSSSTANPSFESDPRISSNSADFPTDMVLRASVFMPMMLDNNQLDKRISGADVSFAWPRKQGQSEFIGFKQQGITRYDHDPTGADSSTIRYKNLGFSGDHLHGAVGAFSPQMYFNRAGVNGASTKFIRSESTNASMVSGLNNPDISLDSSAAIGPKYRMRMALACFLKDGTYVVNNGGAILPYIYDSERTIGGANTETLYAVWDGYDGVGNSQTYDQDCSAQIYPMFDFVQGPLCPSQQGSNFDISVIEQEHKNWPTIYDSQRGNLRGNWAVNTTYATDDVVFSGGKSWRAVTAHTSSLSFPPSPTQGQWTEVSVEGVGTSQTDIINPRQHMVRPNPQRVPIIAIEKSKNGDASLTHHSKLVIYTDASTREFHGGFGMPIYIAGLTGVLGSGADADALGRSGKWVNGTWTGPWDGRDTSPTGYVTNTDHNGWWIMESVGATTTGSIGSLSGTHTYRKVVVSLNYRQSNTTEVAAYSVQSADAFLCQGRMTGHEGRPGSTDQVAFPEGSNIYLVGRYGDLNNNLLSTGTGFNAGVSLPDSNTPAGASADSTYPSRVTIFNPTEANSEGKFDNTIGGSRRSLGIRADNDDTFLASPSVSTTGGAVLRLPPPLGWDLAHIYYSGSDNYKDGYQIYGTQINEVKGDYVFTKSPPDRWAFRGIHIPFWSFIDPQDGRHAWDYIKPVGTTSTWTFGRNRPWPPRERIGTNAGYSPSLSTDAATHGWNVAASGNYLASGVESTKYGLTEMGCSPVWLDMTMKASIPVTKDRLWLMEFDNGISYGTTGRHSMLTHGFEYQRGHGFYPLWDGSGTMWKQTNGTNDDTHNHSLMGSAENTANYPDAGPPTFVANRPAVWAWGSDSEWFLGDWDDDRAVFPIGSATAIGGNAAYGGLGNGYGYGGAFTLTQGYHEIRTVFTEAGMSLIVDGTSIGTDTTSGVQVRGMTIKVCDSFALATSTYTGAQTFTDTQGQTVIPQRPSLNPGVDDLQIDSMILRQIPTAAMLPFNVDTTNQKVTTAKRYTSLAIEADNVDDSKGMKLRVSIMQPPSKIASTIEQEASTAYAGFDLLDPEILGGSGSIDLTGLPASAITNGFMVRFHFYIPTNSQTQYHPINWNALPVVRSFTVNYDETPTTTLVATANTFNGDTTSPIGCKVGHIVSFRATVATTDADRTLSSVKFNFGDGIETGFLPLSDTTTQSTTFDVSHVYTKAGTFSVTSTTKDDAGNVSDASSVTSVVVANTKPVAVLRATPGTIEAGSTVTFDGSSSYIVSSDSNLTIDEYHFTAGDGSAQVDQAGATKTHTYSSAGEYEATLTVTDDAASPNTSTASKVVIKVLPASSAVDLLAQLNTRPNAFQRSRIANLVPTSTLDGTFPEVRDTGQRSDEFTLTGSFLKGTATTDILTMEGYLSNGTLVFVEWETTDFAGNASVQRFTGRMTSFEYDREGGRHGETPYSATFRREE